MEFNTIVISDGITMGMEGMKSSLPGPGACGSRFTANTMAMALEFSGLSPMGTAGVPAVDPHKDDISYRCDRCALLLMR
jgi:dihydroxy-acid dehydratase